jgi:hypothetical protein
MITVLDDGDAFEQRARVRAREHAGEHAVDGLGCCRDDHLASHLAGLLMLFWNSTTPARAASGLRP